jgi:hypothetical protein
MYSRGNALNDKSVKVEKQIKSLLKLPVSLQIILPAETHPTEELILKSWCKSSR